MASRTINLNSIITGTVDCSNNVNVKGTLDVTSTVTLRENGTANGQGTRLKLRGTQSGDVYQIEYNNATTTSPNNLDIRLVGADDAGNNRKFDFGYYTGDSRANTWNSKMTINSYNGNVGINTTAPVAPLQVVGNVRFVAGSTDATNACITMYNQGTGVSVEAFQGNLTSTKRPIYLNAFGGNVAVGTTDTTGGTLTVNGSLNVLGTYPGIGWDLGTANTTGFYRESPNIIRCFTANTERMRVTATGTVSIGSTAPPTAGPPKLYVYSSGAGSWDGFGYFGGDSIGIVAGALTVSGTRRAIVGAHNAALNAWAKCTVSAGANCGIGALYDPAYQLELGVDSAGKPGTGGLWTVTSDSRIKKNIVDADLGICFNNIKSMRLRRFEWDSEYYDERVIKDRKVIGFIAQEVKEVFPKAVEIQSTRTFSKTLYDESGNVIIDEDTKLPKTIDKKLENVHTLNSDQIMNTHIGATQMLIQKVEALEASNATLVTKVETLESTNATLMNRLESLEAINSILMGRLEALEQRA